MAILQAGIGQPAGKQGAAFLRARDEGATFPHGAASAGAAAAIAAAAAVAAAAAAAAVAAAAVATVAAAAAAAVASAAVAAVAGGAAGRTTGRAAGGAAGGVAAPSAARLPGAAPQGAAILRAGELAGGVEAEPSRSRVHASTQPGRRPDGTAAKPHSLSQALPNQPQCAFPPTWELLHKSGFCRPEGAAIHRAQGREASKQAAIFQAWGRSAAPRPA